MAENEKFLRMEDLTARYGLSRAGLAKLAKRGAFPPGIRLGRCRRWPLSVVLAWEQEQV